MLKVSRKFLDAFQKCMDYYECTAEEIEFEKKRIRADYRNAEICYLSIAERVK
jgi:hypothetical protein